MIVVLGELGGQDEYSLVSALKEGKQQLQLPPNIASQKKCSQAETGMVSTRTQSVVLPGTHAAHRL